ncbi:MAG: ABC transporter permease [Chloroflexi bacterium]|nr:ABC transporter permease [Chloroflexota bacterium]
MPGISRETRIILGEEFRRQIRRRSWQFFTVLVPLGLLAALFIVPMVRNAVTEKPSTTPLNRVGYVDNAGVILDFGIPEAPVRYNDRSAGVIGLIRGDVDAIFVIPTDYVTTGQVEWLRVDGGFLSDDSLAGVFREFLTVELIAGLVDPDVLDRVIRPASFTIYDVADDGTVTEEAPQAQQAGEFFVPFIFAVLLMIAIFSGSGSLLQSVADEKENRMIEMIITSATPLSIMAGKVLALGIAGLIQVSVWIVSAAILAPQIINEIPNAGDLRVAPELLLTVLLLFVSGYFLFAVVMAGVGAATTSVREASQFSALVTIPAVVPVWLSSLLVSQPDGTVAQVLSYVPVTAPTTILIRLSAGNVSPLEVATSVAVVLASALVLLWVSARIFRAGLLLYGQRMSLKNVWAALRAD